VAARLPGIDLHRANGEFSADLECLGSINCFQLANEGRGLCNRLQSREIRDVVRMGVSQQDHLNLDAFVRGEFRHIRAICARVERSALARLRIPNEI